MGTDPRNDRECQAPQPAICNLWDQRSWSCESLRTEAQQPGTLCPKTEDGCLSSRREKESFSHLLFCLRSVHWLVPTHIGEGNPLLYQLIQTLISSRNNLKNTARLSYLHIPSPDWQSRNYGKRDCTKIRRSSLPCVGDSALAEASMSSTQSFWLLCLNSDEIQL